MTDRMRMETPDLTEKNIEKIAELFPNCITESKDEKGNLKKAINFNILKQMLSKEIVDGDEAYEFTWVGKKAAMLEANKPIRKTLRPCPEESLNWDTTQNLYIEGDNLDVLKLLQESYLGKIKMIYIDPPYNTGNDFIYKDDFAQSLDEYEAESGQVDEEGNKLFKNSETNGRFHSDWCSMMYSRLMVARNLLSDDGVIFISIDDSEQENLKKICDEVFGASCFVSSTIWRSSDNSNNDAKQFSNDHNYTLIYSKSQMWQPQKLFDESKRKHFKNPDNDPKGPWFDGNPLNSPNYRENLIYTIKAPNGNIIEPPKNGWRWSKETLQEKMNKGEIYFNADQTNIKRRTYLCDMEGLPPSTLWTDLTITGHNRQAKYELLDLIPENVFDTPKPVKLLSFIINLVKDNKNAIILDFFCGSGTTAEAVMRLNAQDSGNRKFIMIQLPENLDYSLAKASNDKKPVLKNAIELCEKNKVGHFLTEIGKERIRRAGKKILEEYKNTPFVKGGCQAKPDRGIFKDNVETETTVKGKISPSALQAATPLYERGSLEPFATTGSTNDGNGTEQQLDIGFRVFKLADSNMKDVYYSADEYSQQSLQDFVSNIKEDRTDLDLLFGCLLEWGLPLSMPYSSEKINGFNVHTYNDGDLIACFDENISEEVIKIIAKRNPLRAVFRDSSFANSPSKINVTEIFKLLSPNTRVKVI